MRFGRVVNSLRSVDRRITRWRSPEERLVLVNARTPMNYAVMSPVCRALEGDARLRLFYTSSERPAGLAEIYGGGAKRLVVPRRAALMRFDAYLAADFIWVTLPRGTRRVQMFHGVAGKYSHVYDRPSRSMREWDRFFFINERRMRNFIAAGAIDADGRAARLIGMPKVDCLVDGSLDRDRLLAGMGIDPALRTVLYAPTWSPYSSLNAMGEELIAALAGAGFTVLVKLHDRSRDAEAFYSGGVNWAERLRPVLARTGARLVEGSDSCPHLAAADVLITDHSSIGFEYLLLDRPLVRVEMPELITRTNIPEEYVAMMADASTSARTVAETVAAVERAFAAPEERAAERRAVAQDLFYRPGTATRRAVEAMYELLELDLPNRDFLGDSSQFRVSESRETHLP